MTTFLVIDNMERRKRIDMDLSYIKGMGFRNISLHVASKEKWGLDLPAGMKDNMVKALKNKGTVINFFAGKANIGFFVFDYKEDYLPMPEVEKIFIDQKESFKKNITKAVNKMERGAMVLIDSWINPSFKEYEDKLIKSAIEHTQYHMKLFWAVQYEDKLYGRREPKHSTKFNVGYLIGFCLGVFCFGSMFHNYGLGICFGAAFAMSFGAMFSGEKENLSRWDEYENSDSGKQDLINNSAKDYVGVQ